jgi:NAD(P)-dependent dehydrogenase (short-subunit alcohol dehydrogenase family)
MPERKSQSRGVMKESSTRQPESLNAVAIRADVANEADVQRAYREVLQAFGHLDILVNNAGFGIFKKMVDMDREGFDSVFATNVTGAMLMGREAAKALHPAKQGEHRQHLFHGQSARRRERHRLLREQVCAARHDGMLAGRASSV